jgi:hypothetical protein
MRLYKFSSFLLSLTLFACATQSGIWVKGDVTPLQFNQDNYACLQESQQPYGYSQGGYGWGNGWLEGWNGRALNQYEAKRILVGALGVLAVHYRYARPGECAGERPTCNV